MSEKSLDAIATIFSRNKFYKDSHHMVLALIFMGLIVLGLLIGTIFYMITHPPEPRYFATTNDGQIMQVVPLEQPNLTQSELLQWASTAATAAYTYSYSNWRYRLQDLSQYFTPEGWKQFTAALTATNNLEAVKTKRLIVNAAPTGPAVLTREGLFQGRYTWKVEIPLLVTYQNANQFVQQSLLVTMVITRMSMLTSERGVAVSQFIATERQ